MLPDLGAARRLRDASRSSRQQNSASLLDEHVSYYPVLGGAVYSLPLRQAGSTAETSLSEQQEARELYVNKAL